MSEINMKVANWVKFRSKKEKLNYRVKKKQSWMNEPSHNSCVSMTSTNYHHGVCWKLVVYGSDFEIQSWKDFLNLRFGFGLFPFHIIILTCEYGHNFGDSTVQLLCILCLFLIVRIQFRKLGPHKLHMLIFHLDANLELENKTPQTATKNNNEKSTSFLALESVSSSEDTGKSWDNPAEYFFTTVMSSMNEEVLPQSLKTERILLLMKDGDEPKSGPV